MPRKIGFSVIHSSGVDAGYTMHDLEVHSPLARGWQSQRFCLYPQEIVIELAGTSHIRKLQLLAHQYLIATKIEFFIGRLPPNHIGTLHGTSYQRLGYVMMSDNSKTGYKARELKSVHVDTVGKYLRLVIHKNHNNKYNVYNQVSLIAINVIGDEVTPEEEARLSLAGDQHKINQIIEDFMPEGFFNKNFNDSNDVGDKTAFGSVRKDYISPLDDLAFDMYLDPEVAQIIRKLDVRKNEAVIQEQYDLAKKLKEAIADLQNVGGKLGRFEVEKRRAIETEDYDLAKIKKVQMEEYRRQIYQQLEIYDLLQLTKSGSAMTPKQKDKHPIQPSNERTHEPINRPTTRPTIKPTTRPVDRSPNRPAIRPDSPARAAAIHDDNPTTSDDRPLPTMKHNIVEPPPKEPDKTEPEQATSEAVIDSLEEAKLATEPAEAMNEDTLREAAAAIDIYGQDLVAKIYSKNWTLREEAFRELKDRLTNDVADTDRDALHNVLKVCVFLSCKGLKDKVFAVFMSTLSLVRLLYKDWIPKHKPSKGETAHSLESVVPALMARIGDTNARLKMSSIDFIVELARFKDVRPLHVVPHHCTTPLKGTTQARTAVTRVDLAEKLLTHLGVDKHSGLTVDNLMTFANRALEHTAGEVREAAVHLILQLYRLKPTAVRSHLPPEDDSKILKNPLYCKIFDGMDRVDGKPTKAERKAKTQSNKAAERQQKQAEIEELHRQLAELRAATISTGQAPNASTGKKATQPAQKDRLPVSKKMPRAPSIADQSEFGDDIDKQCIFCSEEDKSFRDEGLDMHYWRHCPMLKRCHSCKQVVEISALNTHLLTECEERTKHAKCPRCGETRKKSEIDKHIADKMCQPLVQGMCKCPLCHLNILAEDDKDENWKKHLMGSGKDACSKNPRREASIKRIREKKTKPTAQKVEATPRSKIPTKDRKPKSKTSKTK